MGLWYRHKLKLKLREFGRLAALTQALIRAGDAKTARFVYGRATSYFWSLRRWAEADFRGDDFGSFGSTLSLEHELQSILRELKLGIEILEAQAPDSELDAESGPHEGRSQVTLQPTQKPMREPTNPLYVLLLLAILAAMVYPQVCEYMEQEEARPDKWEPIMFREVKRSAGRWERPVVPGWELKAAFYRPLAKYELGLPGQQTCVLVLQKK